MEATSSCQHPRQVRVSGARAARRQQRQAREVAGVAQRRSPSIAPRLALPSRRLRTIQQQPAPRSMRAKYCARSSARACSGPVGATVGRMLSSWATSSSRSSSANSAITSGSGRPSSSAAVPTAARSGSRSWRLARLCAAVNGRGPAGADRALRGRAGVGGKAAAAKRRSTPGDRSGTRSPGRLCPARATALKPTGSGHRGRGAVAGGEGQGERRRPERPQAVGRRGIRAWASGRRRRPDRPR